MSARVLNPIILTEFCKLGSPSVLRRSVPSNRKLNRIKKDLFGPPNPSEIKKFFQQDIKNHQDAAAQKWGFDFQNGYPLMGKSQFIWERVPCEDFIPAVYTLSRAAHVREFSGASDANAAELLLDQRAEKQNQSSSPNRTFVEELVDDSVLFSVPLDDSLSLPSGSMGKRQPKITEYMKERKRLAPTPKKISPAKRHRTSIQQTLTQKGTLQRSHR